MSTTFSRNTYKAFGLVVLSEIVLPELTPISMINHIVDVKIEKAELHTLWLEQSEGDDYYIIKPNWIMFHVPEVALFCIENGNTVTFSLFEGTSEDAIRLFLLGSCMGAILMQRKVLPLHGSALAIEGKAYAIVGDSGAGKSTLASAFLQRGYHLLSDDVIAVSLNEHNEPIVTPAYPQQKLWQESLTHFEMTTNDYQPLIYREDKYAIPVTSQFHHKPLPLAGIFELVKLEDCNNIEIRPIRELERLHKLYYHTYRNFFIQESGLMEWHFTTTSKISHKIDFYQISRPTTSFTAHELVELILHTLKTRKESFV